MRKKKPDISDVQRRVANISIGASTLRGQKKGSVQKTREYLKKLNLTELENINESEFTRWLNERTEELQKKLPEHRWGVARKAINVFLENGLYDKFLSEQYNLDALEAVLEIPLDSNVAKGLLKDEESAIKFPLPKWESIQGLNSEVNKEYQDCAQDIAQRKQTSRIYLDLEYWRGEKRRKPLKPSK